MEDGVETNIAETKFFGHHFELRLAVGPDQCSRII